MQQWCVCTETNSNNVTLTARSTTQPQHAESSANPESAGPWKHRFVAVGITCLPLYAPAAHWLGLLRDPASSLEQPHSTQRSSSGLLSY